MKNLQAFVVKKPYQTEWKEVPEPAAPGPEEVLIKIKAAGICGTDIHIYHGKHGAVTYPRIPGHELVGEVIAVGAKVAGVKAGDRVAVDPVVSCGQCVMCTIGRHNICHQVKCLGVQTEGGFTEIIKINSKRVYPFSPQVEWEIAALVEPFSIAAQIADRLRITKEDKVLIIGGGTIGLALLQIVQNIYQAQVIVADISENKLKLAEKMAAQGVINPRQNNALEKAQEIWEGKGPTVVVEAVGNSKILNDLIDNAPPGCRLGVIGFMTEPITISPMDITKRELEIIGSRMNKNKFPDVLKWFQEGKLDGRLLITHKYKFTDLEKVFPEINNNPEEVCKVIINFEEVSV